MDPLSLTASIIAIVQISGTIGKGLKKIVNLRNAPDIFLALNNEVADLQCILQDVNSLLRQRLDTTGQEPLGSLVRALEKAKQTLSKLEILLAYDLTTTKRNGNEARLDRSVWIRAEAKVHQIKDEIREDKSSLSSALSILTSFTSLRTHAQMQSVCILLQTLGIQSRNGEKAAIEAVSGEDLYEVDLSERSIVRMPPFSQSVPSPPRPAPSFRQASHGAEAALAYPPEQPYATTIGLIRNICNGDCNCACHESFRFRSPGFLDSIFGSLFLGYEASPWSSKGCQNAHCRKSHTTVHYMFPRWFCSRTVAITLSCNQPGSGPEFLLRVLQMRPNDARIFKCARYGYVEETKRLLEGGEASIVDVNSYSCTALHIALGHGQFEIAELLVRAGADKFHEDEVGMQPYTIAWENLLSKERSRWNDNDHRLCELFGDHSQLDLFHFPDLHKAFLGVSGKTFESVLSSRPRSSIDETDAIGRTVLSWASQRGDKKTMGQLLCCGADPNHTDASNASPLHWSIYSEDETSLQLLLRAKAEVELKDVCGRTTLCAIASEGVPSGMSVELVNILLRYGANVETREQNGHTPLHRATLKNNHHIVAALLKKGANINATTSTGHTALHLAVFNRSHEALRVLLDHSNVDYNVEDHYASTWLRYAVYYADIETIHILSSKSLNEPDCMDDEGNCDGHTAKRFAQWRKNFNDDWSTFSEQPRDYDPVKWYTAFEKLLDSLVNAENSRTRNSIDEGNMTLKGDMIESSDTDSEGEDNKDSECWRDAVEEIC